MLNHPELVESCLRLEEVLLVLEALAGQDVPVLVVGPDVGPRAHCVRVEDGFSLGDYWEEFKDKYHQ